jgi:RimJ/RimL family protein N-acetyltransferase
MTRTNEFGLHIGPPLDGWSPPPLPPRAPLVGRYCTLEPLSPAHAVALHAAYLPTPESWTYLAHGPYPDLAPFAAWVEKSSVSADPLFFAVLDGGTPVAIVSYLRITPAAGSIEVGHIHYSAAAKRTRAATESMFLLMRQAFNLGYRRYEWKCDSLNAASRAAARRLGFSFEGVFRNATVYKNRSRDTAWHGITDADWPALCAAFETWLSPDNFDADGRQKVSLSALTAPLRTPAPQE